MANLKYTKRKILTILSIAILITIAVGRVYGYRFYSRMIAPNFETGEKEHIFIYIPTGSSFNDVLKILDELGVVINSETFHWASSKLGYPQSVSPGRYRMRNGQNNREVINMLRAGL